MEKPTLLPKFQFPVIPNDHVPMTQPHTCTAKTGTLRGSSQSRQPGSLSDPPTSPPGNTASSGETTAVSRASTSQRFRVGNPAQSRLKTKEKNLGQQELPYQGARERAPAINTPSSDLLPQKGSLAEHHIPENLGIKDFQIDQLTPTHLLESSAPAPAPGIVRAERKQCQLCPMRAGTAVPAAWIQPKGKHLLPLPLYPPPAQLLLSTLPLRDLNDRLRNKTLALLEYARHTRGSSSAPRCGC